MKLTTFSIIFTCLTTSSCQELNTFFEKINEEYLKFNQIAAAITWESSINPTLSDRAATYQQERIKWQQNICDKLAELSNSQMLNDTQKRQMYLLCRGPKFTFEEARQMSSLYEELQSTYSEAEICIQTPKIPTNPSPADKEAAILFYLTAVREMLPSKGNNSITIAAKVAASNTGLQMAKGSSLLCLNGEEDLDKMMRYSKNDEVLKWLWLVWREKVGPTMRRPYRELVNIENRAARRNGYTDIGASWREELETPNLRTLSRQLYEEIRPLYTMLHGVVRFYLRREYGDAVSEHGAIPAHLLGNLWSQNWESLLPLIIPRTIDLDQSIQSRNWTVFHMLKQAEDSYQSLGLPPMTKTFWNQSVFERKQEYTRCHGTAADMFTSGDYRLLYCSGTSAEDLYVIHHEMGHIQYYMAYKNQSGIFRAAQSALHETIGDTIMYGVMTPQHLHRLGLINDSILFSNDVSGLDDDDDDLDIEISTDNILLLKIALSKLPQIPLALLTDEYRWKYFEGQLDEDTLNREFWTMARELQGIEPPAFRGEEYFDAAAKFHVPDNTPSISQVIPVALLTDEYRWKYFEGQLDEDTLNEEFWTMARELQGIEPPVFRGEEYFDAAAKFHVPDNTPSIRYFLSSFLQHQLFETLCKATVFGRKGITKELPASIPMHRCDIYGSRPAGKVLKDLMSRGHSKNWQEMLSATTGNDDISASALKRYYRPLYKLLTQIIRKYRIPIGW